MKISESARQFIKKMLINSTTDFNQHFLLSSKESLQILMHQVHSIELFLTTKISSDDMLIFFPCDEFNFCCYEKDWPFFSQCFIDVTAKKNSNIPTLSARLIQKQIHNISKYLEENVIPLLATVGLKITIVDSDFEKNNFIFFYHHAKNSPIKKYIELIQDGIMQCLANHPQNFNFTVELRPAEWFIKKI